MQYSYDGDDDPTTLRFEYHDEPEQDLKDCMFCSNKRLRDDLRACIECGVVLCEECTKHFRMQDFCNFCAVCRICKNEAAFWCEFCSELLCSLHVKEDYEYCDASGYRSIERTCIDGCRKSVENKPQAFDSDILSK